MCRKCDRARLVVIACLLTLLALLIVAAITPARSAGMMGVGQMMQPSAGGGVPGGGFALTTEAGDPLSTEAGSIIVTENAP